MNLSLRNEIDKRQKVNIFKMFKLFIKKLESSIFYIFNCVLNLKKVNFQSIDRLFHYFFAKHQKFESSTLYTQNYISDFEKVNNQLLACFIIFVIFHCDILQIK